MKLFFLQPLTKSVSHSLLIFFLFALKCVYYAPQKGHLPVLSLTVSFVNCFAHMDSPCFILASTLNTTQDETFLCDQCEYTTKRKRALKDHIEAVHLKKFFCEICNKYFSGKVKLDNHMQVIWFICIIFNVFFFLKN